MKKLISALILIMSSHSFATPKCSITLIHNLDDGSRVWHALFGTTIIGKFPGEGFSQMIDYKNKLASLQACEFDDPSLKCYIEIEESIQATDGTPFPHFIVFVGNDIVASSFFLATDFLDASVFMKMLIDERICTKKEQ